MSMLSFAHNGISHANGLDSAVHQAAGNILWLAASAAVLAIILHAIVSLLNRRQTQEIRQEEPDRR